MVSHPTWSPTQPHWTRIVEAPRRLATSRGEQVALALDVASSEFYNDGAYEFEGQKKSAAEMSAYYADLVAKYPWFP